MKLKNVITSTFFVMILLIGSIGFISLSNSENALEDQIGKEAAALTAQTLKDIDKGIYLRIEQLMAFANDHQFAEQAVDSNRYYQNLFNARQHIDSLDSDWIKGKTTPPIEAILNNDLSQNLRRKIQNLEQRFGYPIFGELAVINRYGVLVGVYPRMTDFNQADES